MLCYYMHMMISFFVAVSENDVIGDSNTLPWHLPADLRRFKELTMGHPMIMGRKTHESIGRALPGRRNIVITTQSDFTAEGCDVVRSLDEALQLVKNEQEVFIIGGGSVYAQALPQANKIYLTKVHAITHGDVTFTFDTSQWREITREDHTADEKNQYDYSFITYIRK